MRSKEFFYNGKYYQSLDYMSRNSQLYYILRSAKLLGCENRGIAQRYKFPPRRVTLTVRVRRTLTSKDNCDVTLSQLRLRCFFLKVK